MGKFLFVDNSNVWIEGMKVSAVYKGFVPDVFAAGDLRLSDSTWRIDFGKLYHALNGNTLKKAFLYGSVPPLNDSLWDRAERAGFEVKTFERSRYNNREKKVDTQIAADMFEVAVDEAVAGEDEILLIAGDADYVPQIEKIKKRGIRVIVAFWDHASRELVEQADQFISLNTLLTQISH